LILCPVCNKIAHYNSYFGRYICTKCRWRGKSADDRGFKNGYWKDVENDDVMKLTRIGAQD
jgi:hypothetical protein